MFYPVAIRICTDSCTGAKKLRRNQFYYFINKVSITSDSSHAYIEPYRVEDELFSQKRNNAPQILVSAIVGENGAGKSTIVEMLIRMINNFLRLLSVNTRIPKVVNIFISSMVLTLSYSFSRKMATRIGYTD